MLEARKENKVYKINEQQKDRYLKDGFDIYENDKVIEYTPKKLIKYSEHLSQLKKVSLEKDTLIQELKGQLKDLEKMKVEPPHNVLELLKGYAEMKSIDIGSSTSATGILTKILEVEKE